MSKFKKVLLFIAILGIATKFVGCASTKVSSTNARLKHYSFEADGTFIYKVEDDTIIFK